MSKRLLLNQVTLCSDGSIGLQWLKQVIDAESGEVEFSEPHRTFVGYSGDIRQQWDAAADHLEQMGYPRPDDSQFARVQKIDAVGRTDLAIEAERGRKTRIAAASN